MDVILQQELCKQFSSEFFDVDKQEVSLFVTVMQMVKAIYASQPEVYRTLLSILLDYDPSHQRQTIKYLRVLLEGHPELGDYLVAVLPKNEIPHPPQASTDQTQPKKRLQVQFDHKQLGSKKDKDGHVKFYNYTPPVVSAYVASRGTPGRITSVQPSESATKQRALESLSAQTVTSLVHGDSSDTDGQDINVQD